MSDSGSQGAVSRHSGRQGIWQSQQESTRLSSSSEGSRYKHKVLIGQHQWVPGGNWLM